MKKILVSLLLVSMLLVVGCQNNNQDKNTSTGQTPVDQDQNQAEMIKEAIDISVYGLNGPTSMGMIQMFEEDQTLDQHINVTYTNVAQPDVVVGKLIKGEIDIAAVPTNVASMIYNKTQGQYQVAAVNTLGVLYIMTPEGVEINDMADLKGKTIYTSGLGATPEYVLNHTLAEHGLRVGEDVFVEYKPTHQEVSAGLVMGEMEVVMLPQPFVTLASMEADVKIALSLQDAWASIEEADLAMGCLVVKTSLAEQHPEVVDAFLNRYEASVDWVNENPLEASVLVEKYKVLPKAKVAELAIPNSNIVFMKDETMQMQMESILQIMFDYNPKSIGGTIPDEGFYYKK